MQARQVAAGQGWQWLVGGFGLFRKNPLIWLALIAVYFLIALALSIIPIVGQLLFQILAPVFAAGFMLGCRALEQGEELEIAHLFAGFRAHTVQLVTVGGLYLTGVLLFSGMIMLLGGGTMLKIPSPEELQGMDEAAVAAMGKGMLLALLTALALVMPLLMAYWFAPALVALDGLTAVEAMKLSFVACLRNMLPFLVYGTLALVLLVLASIPFGLGLLVMIPVMLASQYASYRDIFADRPQGTSE